MENQHTGHIEQTIIYTGKLFRMFIFQNDWKMLAMASIIGALISFVISDTLFVSMKGTLTGAFALVCICIWNGWLSNFGLTAVCAIGDYNSLPNDIILEAIDNIDIYSPSNKDTDDFFAEVAPEFSSVIKELSEDEEMRSDFADVCGVMSYNMRCRSTDGNIVSCRLNIAFQVVFFSAATVIVLEFIDKDKR